MKEACCGMERTHDIHGPSRTGNAFRIVQHYIAGAKDALDRTFLDIELEVAETIASIQRRISRMFEGGKLSKGVVSPLFGRKVPVGHSTIAQVFSQQDIDTPYDMPHHTITNYDDVVKAA